MNGNIKSVIGQLRQPKYTGQNRCIPCTIVNITLLIGVSGVLMLISAPIGAISLIGGLGIIYLRGYLVPGTPTLTKRYLPAWFLRYFEHAEPLANTNDQVSLIGESNEIDPEPVLRNIGAIEVCEDETDLCLTEEFSTAWHERRATIRDEDYLTYLGEWLDTDPTTLAIETAGPACTVTEEGTPIVRWESKAALLADLAAERELRRRYSQWETADLSTQGQLLHALRVFLESCPLCNTKLQFSQEAVESCCRSVQVVTLTCEQCDSRLLEVEI